MNRNSVSRFSLAPQVAIERSTFDRSCSVKTSFCAGDCVPFFVDSILPGDTYRVKTSKVVRMQTLKTPILDDIQLDTYWFYVPARLCWEHFREFCGENTESAWIPETEYTIPQIESPSGGWNVGTIADHLGIPPLVSNLSVNALPFRAFALVYNEWFRATPVQDPLVINLTDSTVTGSNGSNYITDTALGGALPKANRYHDYFSSALPSPQFGESIEVALTQNSVLPVYAQASINSHFDTSSSTNYAKSVKAVAPLAWESAANAKFTTVGDYTGPTPGILGGDDSTHSGALDGQTWFQLMNRGASDYTTPVYTKGYDGSTPFKYYGLSVGDTYGEIYEGYSGITPVNLVADGSLAYTTINELRQAFQVQRWLEKTARGGDRYISLLKAHFGVTSPDARLQRPEYLGGNRIRINIRQITQTSSTTDTSPLGDVAAMSVTTDSHYDFEKSFVEHGYLIGMMVPRYKHTYQQGIPREFLRKTKWDLYWPSLAHLGERGIYNSEIYAQGTSKDNEIFGYQEAWSEYRYKPNSVSGMMRSVSNSGLDSWHLADYYNQLPTLSAGWLAEDQTNLDRVLSVTSAVSDQFFADIYVDCKATRPMPLYSIPGLIDHF